MRINLFPGKAFPAWFLVNQGADYPKMIDAVYILKSRGPQEESLLEILKMVTNRTRYEPGCLQSGVWKDGENEEMMVFEVWRSKADFERHVKSPLYRHFLAAIEMSSEEPKISISECEDVRGIEMIEEAMTKKESII